ncbi:hypothetical protein [uncultured Sphingomonas sp.]|uniref:hypothetical protein n=1 Tax=uncultured Sphingomonas sp. TaxID=158754 RepID=UPI0025CDFD16|nr:hypothetical protein [uncultured Sphingomonas sp.]
MLRKTLTITTLALVAACSKAPEDVTAHYAAAGGRGQITVKAAANGDAKLEAGPQTLIRKGGTDYVVITDGNDKFAASFADFVAATQDIAKEKGMKPQALPQDPEYEAVQVGEEKVGDQKGTIWSVQPKGNPQGDSIRIVISDDSRLKNVAQAIGMQTRLTSARMSTMFTSVPKAEKTLEDVIAKGAVLRLGEALTLQDVKPGAIPASEFALPKVLDRAALRQRIQEQANKALEAAKAAGDKAGAAPAPGDAPAQAPAPAPAASPAAK